MRKMSTCARTVLATLLAAGILACRDAVSPIHAVAAVHNEPVRFQSSGVTLAGTLFIPDEPGRHPAIVLLHGSGPEPRNPMVADWFARHGVVALAYDKRGVGESTGEYSGVGVENGDRMFGLLAGDVAAGVRFLRTRPEIDGRRIGLAGNSQAGWILPHAARELGDVRFMVLISGPVCSVGLENYYSDLAEWSDRPLEEVYKQLPLFKGPDGYDPVPVLQSLRTPGLWLLGVEDRSIPVRDTIVNLKALAASGHPFEWRTYEGQGHSLSPVIWNDIGPWVSKFK
jgi:uncharacterized protein